jgi:hypothetical protein
MAVGGPVWNPGRSSTTDHAHNRSVAFELAQFLEGNIADLLIQEIVNHGLRELPAAEIPTVIGTQRSKHCPDARAIY